MKREALIIVWTLLLITPLKPECVVKNLDLFNIFREIDGIVNSVMRNSVEKMLIIMENSILNSKTYYSYSKEEKDQTNKELKKFTQFFSLHNRTLQVQNFEDWVDRITFLQQLCTTNFEKSMIKTKEKLEERVNYFCELENQESKSRFKQFKDKISTNVASLILNSILSKPKRFLEDSQKKINEEIEDRVNQIKESIKLRMSTIPRKEGTKLNESSSSDGNFNLKSVDRNTSTNAELDSGNYLNSSDTSNNGGKEEIKLSNGDKFIRLSESETDYLESNEKESNKIEK